VNASLVYGRDCVGVAVTYRLLRVQGFDKWFLNDDTNEHDEPDNITPMGWFQVIKGYLAHQWCATQALFFRAQGLDARYNTGERWMSQLITFF
jgi:hypothetical protein